MTREGCLLNAPGGVVLTHRFVSAVHVRRSTKQSTPVDHYSQPHAREPASDDSGCAKPLGCRLDTNHQERHRAAYEGGWGAKGEMGEGGKGRRTRDEEREAVGESSVLGMATYLCKDNKCGYPSSLLPIVTGKRCRELFKPNGWWRGQVKPYLSGKSPSTSTSLSPATVRHLPPPPSIKVRSGWPSLRDHEAHDAASTEPSSSAA